uniref:Uncharacterized protein n=1 Tax=Siphoviridae sp. ct4Ap70 TaxID=2825328 RepID=A0A8S5NXX8_9CAUD|nr:MAG TPA: hypothetical protein [Siphoviridae sp. ct4Ap70]
MFSVVLYFYSRSLSTFLRTTLYVSPRLSH